MSKKTSDVDLLFSALLLIASPIWGGLLVFFAHWETLFPDMSKEMKRKGKKKSNAPPKGDKDRSILPSKKGPPTKEELEQIEKIVKKHLL